MPSQATWDETTAASVLCCVIVDIICFCALIDIVSHTKLSGNAARNESMDYNMSKSLTLVVRGQVAMTTTTTAIRY